ncbi:MAG TPA: hypothetical protein VF429_07190, partial [Anaerolineae bacterium]
KLCDTLPRTRAGNIIANQLIRSATLPLCNLQSEIYNQKPLDKNGNPEYHWRIQNRSADF